MHLQPSFGKARAVGEAIISTMFSKGDDARIPVVRYPEPTARPLRCA